jgi:hypothetical protein
MTRQKNFQNLTGDAMRISFSYLGLLQSGIAAVLLVPFAATTAWADVTVTQATTFDLAIIKAHGNKTERISGEKARTDTETHCEGFMSLLCGNQKSGEIIRLDKDLMWELEPDKKSYLEKPFPTPAQIAEAKQRIEKMVEQMKSCPQQPTAPKAPDSSKCDMSPPKFDVNKTNETSMLAGHQAQRTAVTLTQSCKNKETGDSCDMIFMFDTWLTQDEIAGTGDIRAFRTAYNKKLGLDEVSGAVSAQMQQYLAPYADALRQVSAKSGDLKGYPLKTTMRVGIGGEHCAQAAQMRQQKGAGGGDNVVGSAGEAAASAAAGTSAGAATSAASEAAGHAAGGSLGGAIAGSAAGAFGSKLIGGLFAKKPAAQPKPDTTSSTATTATAGAPVSLIEISTETTAISSDSIPGDQFELPSGWKQIIPKPEKEREFQCPQVTK